MNNSALTAPSRSTLVALLAFMNIDRSAVASALADAICIDRGHNGDDLIAYISKHYEILKAAAKVGRLDLVLGERDNVTKLTYLIPHIERALYVGLLPQHVVQHAIGLIDDKPRETWSTQERHLMTHEVLSRTLTIRLPERAAMLRTKARDLFTTEFLAEAKAVMAEETV